MINCYLLQKAAHLSPAPSSWTRLCGGWGPSRISFFAFVCLHTLNKRGKMGGRWELLSCISLENLSDFFLDRLMSFLWKTTKNTDFCFSPLERPLVLEWWVRFLSCVLCQKGLAGTYKRGTRSTPLLGPSSFTFLQKKIIWILPVWIFFFSSFPAANAKETNKKRTEGNDTSVYVFFCCFLILCVFQRKDN